MNSVKPIQTNFSQLLSRRNWAWMEMTDFIALRFVSTGVCKQQQKSHTRQSCRRTWWGPDFCSGFGTLWWLWADSHCCRVSKQGATLTLWSSCGRSRGGRYGEWQGVICTGETNSPVQVEKEQQDAAMFCVAFWTRWQDRMIKLCCCCLCVRRSICSSCGTPSSSWLWSSAPASSFRLAGSTRAPSWTMTLSYRWYLSLWFFLLRQYVFEVYEGYLQAVNDLNSKISE